MRLAIKLGVSKYPGEQVQTLTGIQSRNYLAPTYCLLYSHLLLLLYSNVRYKLWATDIRTRANLYARQRGGGIKTWHKANIGRLIAGPKRPV